MIKKRVACVHEMEQLHTFSHLINRTRRRDIGNFTTRKPETVNVYFTPQQQHLHDTLLTTQQNILRRTHGDINVKFLMINHSPPGGELPVWPSPSPSDYPHSPY